MSHCEGAPTEQASDNRTSAIANQKSEISRLFALSSKLLL